MQVKLILVCTLLRLFLWLPSCTNASSLEGISLDLSCDDFMNLKHIRVCKPMEVDVGDTLKVALCSNQSTGFSWSETALISNQSVVQQIDHQLTISKSRLRSLYGTPTMEVWTFEALAKGLSTIYMEYYQLQELGNGKELSVIFTVVAK